MAEGPKSLGQKNEVAGPEGLVRADDEVGVEKDFQKKYKTPRKATRSRSAFL